MDDCLRVSDILDMIQIQHESGILSQLQPALHPHVLFVIFIYPSTEEKYFQNNAICNYFLFWFIMSHLSALSKTNNTLLIYKIHWNIYIC